MLLEVMVVVMMLLVAAFETVVWWRFWRQLSSNATELPKTSPLCCATPNAAKEHVHVKSKTSSLLVMDATGIFLVSSSLHFDGGWSQNLHSPTHELDPLRGTVLFGASMDFERYNSVLSVAT